MRGITCSDTHSRARSSPDPQRATAGGTGLTPQQRQFRRPPLTGWEAEGSKRSYARRCGDAVPGLPDYAQNHRHGHGANLLPAGESVVDEIRRFHGPKIAMETLNGAQEEFERRGDR